MRRATRWTLWAIAVGACGRGAGEADPGADAADASVGGGDTDVDAPPGEDDPPDTDARQVDVDVQVDFTDAAPLDLEASDAIVDTVTGVARAAPLRELDDPGTGTNGAYDGTVDLPTQDGSYTTFALPAMEEPLKVEGDLTIRATGDVAFDRSVVATGALRVVAGGAVRIGCVEVRGRSVHVEAHGADGVTVACADGTSELSSAPVDGVVGDTVLWSAGKASFEEGYLFPATSGGSPADPGVVTELLVDGDASLVRDSYVIGNDVSLDTTPAGATRIWVSGDLLLDVDTYVIGQSGSTLADHPTEIRVGGDLQVRNDSYVIGATGGSIDLRVEGTATFDADSYVIADDGSSTRIGRLLSLRARGVTLTNGSYLIGADPDGDATAAGGAVTVDSQGPLILDGGDNYGGIYGGTSRCGQGGDVTIRADGEVRIDQADVSAGRRTGPVDVDCPAARGGHATVHTTGAIVRSVDDGYDVFPGGGEPDGTVTLTENDAMLVVPPPDAGVNGTRTVRSAPVSSGGTLDEVTVDATDGVTVEVRDHADAPWTAATERVGTTLPAGWQWQARLPWSIFRGSEVRSVAFRLSVAP